MLKSNGRNTPTPQRLRRYYLAYYNENMLRNYRFIFDQTQHFFKDGERIEYDATSLKAEKYGNKDDSQKRAPDWLIKRHRKRYGTLAGEITYYKSFDAFKDGKIKNRYCDRLFFDFDIDDNPEIEALKMEFKNANLMLTGREYTKEYVELQKEFKDLIFNKHLLRDVYDEAQRLCNHLQQYGLKPYLIFSGSKGAHINVFFNEMQLTNLSEIVKTLARSYSKELNLHYLDFKVFDRERAHKRLQRVQYGTHSKTGLITRPLPLDTSYDEMLDLIKSKKRKPVDFNINEYVAPAGFNRLLMKLDNEIGLKKAERKKRLDKENTAKRLELEKRYGKNYKSFNDIDLRDIASAYGIDGKRESEKTICNCPFHHDVHPSAVIYPARFYCSTCAIQLNYYDFIARLENTTDKDKILDIARRFL